MIYKKHSGNTGIRYDEALDEALRYGWIDGKMKSIDGEKFMLRCSPRKAGSIWSRRNKEKAERLIEQGRMTDAGFARIEEAKRNGLWEAAYTSRTGAPLPSDLEAALSENESTWNSFHNLANSRRNRFIHWLNSARTEEARRRRIAEIVKRSALNEGLRDGN